MRLRSAMSRYAPAITADELMQMPDDGYWYELAEGRLIRMPKPGARHGIVGMRLCSALVRFVEARALGEVFPQDTGFLLARDPDTVRAPDLAFVTRRRVAEMGVPDGFWPGAPDLAVEVRSPHDRLPDLRDKADEYLACGTRLVWIVDPAMRRVIAMRAGEPPVTLPDTAMLDGGDLLPGFQFAVHRLFE